MSPSTWLIYVHHALMIPRHCATQRVAPPNVWHHLRGFQWLFHRNSASQLVLRTFPNSLKSPQKSSIWSHCALYLHLSGSKPSTRGSVAQFALSLSQAPPKPAQAATICRSLRSSYQVALGWAQAAAELGLHQSAFQKATEQIHPEPSFRPHPNTTQQPQQMTHPKHELSRLQCHTEAKTIPWGQPMHNSSSSVVPAIPVNQP